MNPKNDVVCAFFALVLLGTGVRTWVDRWCGWDRALFIGLTLGLLLLTKGTGVTVAVPVCLLIGIGVLRARGPRGLAPGMGMVVIALAINAPHWARNIETFKTPIGHTAAQTRFPQRNLIHTPAAVASNLVRNIAMELATPWPNVNERMRREVERVHRVLGLSTNDPRTTLMVKDPFKVPENWREDGDNPSHVHLLLGALMLGAIAARPRAWLQAPAWPFYLVGPATFVLFSALLTWQPWQNRLLIPVLMMGIPFGAVLLNLGWAVYPRTIAAVLAPALAWPCLLYNESKPLVGPQAVWGRPREEVLFEVQPAAREPIEKAVEYVRSRSPRSVGLWLGWTNSYYLLRPLVWPREGAPRLVMVNVNFGPKPAATELPELMVRWPSESAAVGQKYASRMYVGAAEFGPVLVLVPERPGPRR